MSMGISAVASNPSRPATTSIIVRKVPRMPPSHSSQSTRNQPMSPACSRKSGAVRAPAPSTVARLPNTGGMVARGQDDDDDDDEGGEEEGEDGAFSLL